MRRFWKSTVFLSSGLEGCKREHVSYPRAFVKETCSDAKVNYKNDKDRCTIDMDVKKYMNMYLEEVFLTTEFVQLLEDFYCVFTDVIKDDKTFSMIKKESVPLAGNRNPRSESILRDCGGPRDEKGHVIEDSMFKLFNDSGGKVRKRSSECITG
uniref:Uncharacterized protein n=1 Tax=Chenopodium quinoa TaxID=63459 RepID=A0A803MKP7_CHEQI